MGLLDSELERELRDTVAEMLAAQSPPARVLAHCEDGQPYDPALWRTLAVEMGLAGLAVPEKYGGAGASLREAAVVLEELGRAVAPVPYLGSAVVATTALLTVDDRELLTGLATGGTTAALAVPFATPPGGLRSAVTVAGDGALTGEVRAVADALGADVLLVPTVASERSSEASDAVGMVASERSSEASDAAGVTGGLYAVLAGAGGFDRRPVGSLDLTRPLCDLTFTGAPARLVAPQAGPAVAAALTAGAALLASEQLGVAQWCLTTTVDYVKTRYQFGRPVGSFQALKHRLADGWVELTQARAVARYAAACAGAGEDDLPVAAALGQAFCGPVAVHTAEECVQLHGGIGFTWEHPAHLYLKRAKSASIAFGTADRHRTTLAQLADLPPPPPPS